MKPVLANDGEIGEAPESQRSPPSSALSRWLKTLYQDHYAILTGYLRKKYGSGPPEPEDIVQQTFAQLSRLSEAAIAQIDHPKSFLYRSAENILIGERRKALVRSRYATETRTAFFETLGCVSDPESVLVTRDELALIEETIRTMPHQRRNCFLLHRMEELSFAEIGRKLGMSGAAARKHVERGLRDIERAVARAESDLP